MRELTRTPHGPQLSYIIPIANMVRNRRLADKIAQQGWAAFSQRLQHQAEKAGLRFAKVDPRHTSQTCSACGHVLRDKLTLSERIFECPRPGCGLVADRDMNAAANICFAACWHPPAPDEPGGETPQQAAPGARSNTPTTGMGRPQQPAVTAHKTTTAKAAPAAAAATAGRSRRTASPTKQQTDA